MEQEYYSACPHSSSSASSFVYVSIILGRCVTNILLLVCGTEP